LERLNKILKENGTGFFVGSQLTFVDLIWWYWVENLSDQGVIDVSKHEHLSKFKTQIESRPQIDAYIKNPKRYPIQYVFPRYVIYSYPDNVNTKKALVAAQYGGIKIELPPFKMGVENKTNDFLLKNPTGEVPVMDTPDGPLFESNAIAKYIVRKGNDKGLYGTNDYETSSIDQWIEWTRSKVEPHLLTWVLPIVADVPFNKEKYDNAKSSLAKNLAVFNSYLDGREWVIGKRATLADIIIFSTLASPFQILFEPEFIKPFPNIVAWVQRCLKQPQFQVVFPKFEFCTKEKQPGELRHS